jgi:hypothetical protein
MRTTNEIEKLQQQVRVRWYLVARCYRSKPNKNTRKLSKP